MDFVYKFRAQVWSVLPADDTIRFEGSSELRLVAPFDRILLGDFDAPGQPEGDATLRLLPSGEEIDPDFAEAVRVTGPDFVSDLLVILEEDDDGSGREIQLLLTLDGDPLPEPAIGTNIETFAADFAIEFFTRADEDDTPIFTGPYPTGAEIAFADLPDFELLGRRGESLLPGDAAARLARAQEIARLYEAGLDRDGAIDEGGLNFWIDAAGQGFTDIQIADAFLESPEFTASFGAVDTLSDLELVERLYQNVLNRDGEPAGVEFWTGALAGGFSRQDLLLAFADSSENRDGTPFVETLFGSEPGIWEFPA